MDILANNIKKYRNKLGWNQSKLAKALNTKKNTISNWENGVSTPSLQVIISLSNLFELSLDELVLGTVKNATYPTENVVSQVNDIQGSIQLNNVLVPIKAQASYSAGWVDEYIEEPQYVKVPGVQGEARTFEISGESMHPIVGNGDYLVCTRVEKAQEIKEGVIYVIISKGHGILAKFIRLNSAGLQLISANFVEYRPFIVPLEDVKEIWHARMKITGNFSPATWPNYGPHLVQRLERMEDFIRGIFPDFEDKK